MKTNYLITALMLLTLAPSSGAAAPPSPAFTYQGQLVRDQTPANGFHDLTFQAYGQALGGIPFEPPVTNLAVWVTNGLFTTLVNVGRPEERLEVWIEIGVRSSGDSGPFAILAPRQLVTPTPFALFADRAGEATNALSVAPGALIGSMIAPETITGAHIADAQVVRSLNDLQDVVRLVAGTNVSIAVSGQDLQISATPGTVVTNAGWSLSGNSGTGPGNFLGTLDGQPLELRVNNQRGWRLEPTAGVPNVVGGWMGNTVVAGVQGATIAGGGNRLVFTSPNYHEISANFGFIGGGTRNTVGAPYGGVGGGYNNSIQSNAVYATVGGGRSNTINTNAVNGVVAGGALNVLRSDAQGGTISGGEGNTVGIAASFGAVGGGTTNLVGNGAVAATVSGGAFNTVMTDTLHGTIAGGRGNLIGARSEGSTIGGGQDNRISSDNRAAIISGGGANLIEAGSYTAIAGGQSNLVSADYATVGGGQNNTAGFPYAAILGGLRNIADGSAATVLGGVLNRAGGEYSLAAGFRAQANHDGSFVWSDASSEVFFGSAGRNTFNLRAAGGIHLSTTTSLHFGNDTRQMLNLYNLDYGVGVQDNTLYSRSAANFAWHRNGVHSDAEQDPGPGGTMLMRLAGHGELHIGGGIFSGLSLQDRAVSNYVGAPGRGERWAAYVQDGQFRLWSGQDKLVLETNGTLFVPVLTITGGADLAEPFDMPADIGPGSVVVIDSEHAGRLKLSEQAYDKKVAGVVSGANGVRPGLTLSQQGTLEGTRQVALTGRVYVQADAGPGPIEPGDLLTTSNTPGHARKVTDHAQAQGAILGKAMTGLKEGQGLVLVLVTLQ